MKCSIGFYIEVCKIVFVVVFVDDDDDNIYVYWLKKILFLVYLLFLLGY